MPGTESPKLCECGCGLPAPIAKRTDTAKGHKKGEPTRFIRGHSICLIRGLAPIGEKASNWRGGKRKIQCDQCGNIIYRDLSKIKNAKKHFCNSTCQGKWLSTHEVGSKHRAWNGGKVVVYCAQCGKLLERIPAKVKGGNHFCDAGCLGVWMSIHQRGVNSSGWLGGISDKGYCATWSDKEFRDYILERDGYKCQNPNCRNNSDVLNRHHIDYDKQNCSAENIITVCASCNSRANSDREWHTAYYQAIMSKKIELGAMNYG